MVLAICVGALAWTVPLALTPVRAEPLNQDVGYPRQLLATGDPDEVPVIGEDSGAVFTRVSLADQVDGRTVLKDPFSGEILRTVTTAEKTEIGRSPYVVERFGAVPDKTLVLTFNDEPHAAYTEELLDVLADEGVPATFFGTGANVAKNAGLFERTVRDGHTVGNHTMTHLTSWQQHGLRHRGELVGTDHVMRAVGGYSTPLFRVPKGEKKDFPLAVLKGQQLGYLHVGHDMVVPGAGHVPGTDIRLPELDGKGHVVRLHSLGADRAESAERVADIIAGARAQGYTFTTPAEILPREHRPQAGVQPAFDDLATAAVVGLFTAVPNVLVNWLFWFGIGSLTVMSFLYIVVALIGHRRQRRRQWQDIPDEQLPLVSVVLPVYNEEPVVARTLTALRASDYPNLEVVAVDDGSTDDTLAIMRRLAAEWPQLRVITQPNGGKSVASNHGIMAARGEIVVTLDGDTLFEPRTIRMLARHFYDPEGTRPVGAVAGQIKVGNRDNLITAWQSLEYISGICVTRMAESTVGAISIVPGACSAWRKEALQRAGGYSHDTLAEDADLTLTLQRFGYAVVQENAAVAWTEAPDTAHGLAKQRLRWTYGNLQALWKNKDMVFRPRYGALGMIALPYTVVATLTPLLFLPLVAFLSVTTVMSGEWNNLILFGLCITFVQAVICVVATRMVGESPYHLVIVPVYRLIYEPLRAYLVYASLIQALKGREIGWYKPERTNSTLDMSTMSQDTRRAQRV
ncbi:bifunctional polysaccharide deacetylase/glycosyltransferase family 2 protein [Kocuria sp. M1R5S2]|uniref:bifunctional polysaccharide deacetylase/glycosyltransferase family 2 protein n=1 Tax=Kocuria rhizosphaerae TaxID=3376285 RepID=UPI00379B615F